MKQLTGIGVYTKNLLESMIFHYPQIKYVLFFNALKGETPVFSSVEQNNVVIIRRRIPGKILLEWWRKFSMPTIDQLAGVSDADVFHSPNFLYQPVRRTKIVATVHDLAFLKRDSYGSRYSGSYHREMLKKNIQKADKIITVSHAVKSDILNHFHLPEDKVVVIHHGLNPLFKPQDDIVETRKHLRQRGFPTDYILSIGTVEPRKNFPFLIKVFSKLRIQKKNLNLIIAGKPGEDMKAVETAVRKYELTQNVYITGYVENSMLLDLIAGAELAVFPSWDEGFGFPPLEVAACGIPVVASDIKAHREILGDAAVFFDPNDEEACVFNIMSVLSNPRLKETMCKSGLERSKMFSWGKAAHEHVKIYREICE